MNKVLLMFFAAALFLFTACDNKEKDIDKLRTDMPNAHIVEVTGHTNASNYTYMKVKEKDNEYWIAVPQMEVEDGTILYFTRSMEMKNFQSKALDRTFDSILFVEDISQIPHSSDGKISHPNVEATREDVKVEPLKGGYTIAKVFDEKESLEGKKIKVKGKVVKYNEGILDRNWIHIQDGTGEQGKHDLVITTASSVQIGQTVIAEGTIALDKDFGSGYMYSVLLENAEIKGE
jgi:major membrane immunogen (membrane-anchored lipoprotein)